MMRLQKPLGPFGIRSICRVHEHPQQESVRINPELAFAPIDLFPPSMPRSPPTSVVFVDCESAMLMDDSSSRSSAFHASFRSVSFTLTKVPLAIHLSK